MKTAQLDLLDHLRRRSDRDGKQAFADGTVRKYLLSRFPSTLLKFAIVNHWVGDGQFETHVKILAPDRKEVVVSAPSKFSIETNGYADNVTFFTNVSFERQGAHVIQIYIDGILAAERPLYVHHVPAPPSTVN